MMLNRVGSRLIGVGTRPGRSLWGPCSVHCRLAATAHPMNHYADFAVYGPDGRLALVVEAKRRSGASADWAAEFYRNLVGHGRLPMSPYFLLALADRLYLWRGETGDDAAAAVQWAPDVEADARRSLGPFVESAGLGLDALSGRGLELVVLSWLESLVWPGGGATGEDDWVRSSGLLDAIRGGRVEVEPALV